jgi:hypothetical protein
LRPSLFDKIFRKIGIPLETSGRCSWENYQEFLNTVAAVRNVMREYYQQEDIDLLDAHSFLWTLNQDVLNMPKNDTMSVEAATAREKSVEVGAVVTHKDYGEGTIIINYIANEPGMGIYLYSDPGIGPRYQLSIDYYGYDEDKEDDIPNPSNLCIFDKCWDFTDPLFARCVSPEISVTGGFTTSYQRYVGNKMETHYAFMPPAAEFHAWQEGDENEIIEFVSEYKSLPDDVTIDQIKQIPGVHVEEFVYEPFEESVACDVASAGFISKIADPNATLPPIYTEIKDPCERIDNNE